LHKYFIYAHYAVDRLLLSGKVSSQHFPAMSTLQGREQGEWTQRPNSIVAYKNQNFLSVGVHTKRNQNFPHPNHLTIFHFH